MLKALPTSQTSLPAIIDRNLIFIDKTAFISTYEKSQHAVSLFLRPRRFGKIMFTEILKYYYDAALEKESSGIATNNGVDSTLNSFLENIIIGISDFFMRYPDFVPQKILAKIPHDKKVNPKEYVIGYNYFY